VRTIGDSLYKQLLTGPFWTHGPESWSYANQSGADYAGKSGLIWRHSKRAAIPGSCSVAKPQLGQFPCSFRLTSPYPLCARQEQTASSESYARATRPDFSLRNPDDPFLGEDFERIRAVAQQKDGVLPWSARRLSRPTLPALFVASRRAELTVFATIGQDVADQSRARFQGVY